MSFVLTPDELKNLTGHIRSDAQVRELKHMGIEHRIRRDGTVAVGREHAQQVMGAAKGKTKAKIVEPDWDAIRA